MIDLLTSTFAVASGLQAIGSIFQGFSDAKDAERQARYARRAAARRAQQLAEEGEIYQSRTVASYSAGNVSLESGSVRDALAQNARLIKQDIGETLLQ